MGEIMKIEWPAAYPGAHWFDEREDRAVLDVLHRRALFRYYGLKKPKYVRKLEETAREFYGVEYALGVNSGTGALITAMTALHIGPGSEVILPAFFWVATVGAVVQANAIPVLCEVDESFCMDPQDLTRQITPRTKLIVAVHMAGSPCDMKAIMGVANRHGIPVLEDCAQANGGTFRGRKLGTFGKLGMFSLQWNKNATAGEGGLLVTNDPKLYEPVGKRHAVRDGAASDHMGRWTPDERVDRGGGFNPAQETATDYPAHAGLQAPHQGATRRHARAVVPSPGG
jgi:8-amino-3,8-dideoxy-alpha-D-manno-octulosonate transaminase